jgi:uncharacterized repeat protein (TIGR02543 family)
VKRFLRIILGLFLYLTIAQGQLFTHPIHTYAVTGDATLQNTIDLNKGILNYLTNSNANDFLSMRDLGITSVEADVIKAKALEITASVTDDFDKAMAIHDWITTNIYYNFDGLNSGDLGDNSPYAVYIQRYAVCQGFAELNNAMLRSINIPSVLLFGKAIYAVLGATWEMDDDPNSSNHAYNAVYLNNEWMFIDTGWDTFNRYENSKFIEGDTRRTYFAPLLENFSKDHRTLEISGVVCGFNVKLDFQNSETVTYFSSIGSSLAFLKKSNYIPIKAGYVFDGWYKEPELINGWSYTNDRIYSDLTLYAKWIVVSVTGISLDNSNITLAGLNSSATLIATITPSKVSNGGITWTSDNSNVATVDQYGVVTSKGIGSATITATTADGNFTATATITVTAVSVTSLSLNKTTLNLSGLNSTATLVATISPSNASNRKITWMSDNTSVATVDANGKVVSKGIGSAIISATTEDGGFTATSTVTVTAVSVTGLTLDKSTLDLEGINSIGVLKATVVPSNATNKKVNWSSDNTSVATVDVSGKVTALAAGTATITATAVDGSFMASTVVTVTIPIIPIAVTGITFDKSTLNLVGINSTTSLIASITPTSATNQKVTWTSDNTAVVTVDINGLITSIGVGTATITVTTEDGGMTAVATITVTLTPIVIPVTELIINKSSLNLTGIGSSEKLTSSILPSNATNQNIRWESSDTKVATVSLDGIVTSVGKGTATITAMTEDGSISRSLMVSVTKSISETDRVDFTPYFIGGAGSLLLVGFLFVKKTINKKPR